MGGQGGAQGFAHAPHGGGGGIGQGGGQGGGHGGGQGGGHGGGQGGGHGRGQGGGQGGGHGSYSQTCCWLWTVAGGGAGIGGAGMAGP